MTRRYGIPKPNQKYQVRPGAYAVLQLGGSILLTHQQEPEPEFQLPGGGIDPGESALAALHREVLEETGYRLTTPRRLGAFRRFTYMPEYGFWAEKVCHIYAARPTLRKGPPGEAGHQAIWTTTDEAAALLADEGSQHFLRRFTS